MGFRSGFTPLRTVAALAAAFAIPGLLHAAEEAPVKDPDDPLMFVAGASVMHDNNLFRLDSHQHPNINGKRSRSDTITTTFAGVKIDKQVSLQRFQLDVTAKRYDFNTYNYLDFSGVDYSGAWLWSVTPHLTGTVAVDRTESLASFADFNNQTRRNVQVRETQRATVDWEMTGSYHLLGGLYRNRLNNSVAFNEMSDNTEEAAEAGLKYVSRAGNSLALLHRATRGDYTSRTLDAANLYDTGYDQRETYLQALWRTSGHSVLNARLGYVNRDHHHFSERDFAGTVGSLQYLWTPTGKLSFTLATGRDLTSYQTGIGGINGYTSSYYVNDYVSLMPQWQITAKTALRLKLDSSRRDYRGAIGAIGSGREDRVNAAQVGVNWQAMRHVTVDAFVTRETRSSNLTNGDYRDTIAMLSAQIKF